MSLEFISQLRRSCEIGAVHQQANEISPASLPQLLCFFGIWLKVWTLVALHYVFETFAKVLWHFVALVSVQR